MPLSPISRAQSVSDVGDLPLAVAAAPMDHSHDFDSRPRHVDEQHSPVADPEAPHGRLDRPETLDGPRPGTSEAVDRFHYASSCLMVQPFEIAQPSPAEPNAVAQRPSSRFTSSRL